MAERRIIRGFSQDRPKAATGVRLAPGRVTQAHQPDGEGGQVLVDGQLVTLGHVPGPQRGFPGIGIRTGSTGSFQPGAGGTSFSDPQIRNPLLSASNFELPQTSLELNQWIRYFDRFHPTVGNAMDMHATVPFGKYELRGVADPRINEFYEDMAERMNLFRHILSISREYEVMGEAWPFLQWSDEMNAWDDAIVLNPDYIEVHGINLGGQKGFRYELVLDHQTRMFLQSRDPLDQEIIAEVDPALLRAAQTGLNCPIDPFNMEHMLRMASPYDTRGVSIILGCLKDLLYEEQLREAQYEIAGGIVRPREIWKLGTPGEWMPQDGDIKALRDTVMGSRNDPNFALFMHYGIQVDFIGAERRILPLVPEFQEIEKRILTRLYTSKAATHGEGPTYANASVAMQILDARYAWKRDFIVDYCQRKVFLPVALRNDFREPLTPAQFAHGVRPSMKDRPPVVPDFHWLSKVNLKDPAQQISYLMTLHNDGRLPLKILCDVLQLDYSEVKSHLMRERGTIMDPAVSQQYKTELLNLAKSGGGTPGAGAPPGMAGGGAPGAPGGADDSVEKILEDDEKSRDQDVKVQRQEESKPAPSPVKPPTETAAQGGLSRASRPKGSRSGGPRIEV